MWSQGKAGAAVKFSDEGLKGGIVAPHQELGCVFVPPANTPPSSHLLTQVWVFGSRTVQKDLWEKINFWSHPYSLVLAAPELFPTAICKKKKLTNLSSHI